MCRASLAGQAWDGKEPIDGDLPGTDWDDQGTRKIAFGEVFRSLAAHLGCELGPSLKVQGAYSYEMRKGGKTVRIGLETSYDRWLNTVTTMVEKVDEVWVMTFRWSDPAAFLSVPSPPHFPTPPHPCHDRLMRQSRFDASRSIPSVHARAGDARGVTHSGLSQPPRAKPAAEGPRFPLLGQCEHSDLSNPPGRHRLGGPAIQI